MLRSPSKQIRGIYTRKTSKYNLEHGINRLSLGLQSPQNRELKILGRIHTWEEFQESFFMARDAGFSNINIDLMSAIPEQTYADWEKISARWQGFRRNIFPPTV